MQVLETVTDELSWQWSHRWKWWGTEEFTVLRIWTTISIYWLEKEQNQRVISAGDSIDSIEAEKGFLSLIVITISTWMLVVQT